MSLWNSKKCIFLKRPPSTLNLFFVEVYVSIKLVSCLFDEGFKFLFCLLTAGDWIESFIVFFWICGFISFVLSFGIGISAIDFIAI